VNNPLNVLTKHYIVVLGETLKISLLSDVKQEKNNASIRQQLQSIKRHNIITYCGGIITTTGEWNTSNNT